MSEKGYTTKIDHSSNTCSLVIDEGLANWLARSVVGKLVSLDNRPEPEEKDIKVGDLKITHISVGNTTLWDVGKEEQPKSTQIAAVS